MLKGDKEYCKYIKILEKELIPAMGCTEPIAIAYAAAKAREIHEMPIETVCITVSGNIIKNVKSVMVPNTGKMRGIKVAVAAGLVAGKSEDKLEVLKGIKVEERLHIKEFVEAIPIEIKKARDGYIFDIVIELKTGDCYTKVRILNEHTNIVEILHNTEVILKKEGIKEKKEKKEKKDCMDYELTVKEIWEFVEVLDIKEIEKVIKRQIDLNMAIAKVGLLEDHGANIGKILHKRFTGENYLELAKAYAAAASDARMGGCDMPVIINSGSGNQGITTSVPVIVYGNELGVSKDKLYRALVLSNLLTIHQKCFIGKLSAYCGVVNAGVSAACGVSYLYGGDYQENIHTLVNGIAIASGMVCDGAKPSCAAKLAIAIESGMLGYEMIENGQEFFAGDGLVSKGVEKTIRNIGRLGKDGMCKTDKKIIEIMLGK